MVLLNIKVQTSSSAAGTIGTSSQPTAVPKKLESKRVPLKKTRKSPKAPKVKHRQYSSDRMKLAMTRMKEEAFTVAKSLNLPRSSIRDLHAKGGKECSLGRKPTLPEDKEAELARLLKTVAIQGFPLTVKELRQLVYHYCESNNIPNTFNKNTKIAGYKWWRGFKRRHPGITLRKLENLSRARALGMNREAVAEWFETLQRVLQQSNVMDSPELIWNVDESGLVTVPNASGKVAAPLAPSMLVFKGKNVRQQWIDDAPPDTHVTVRCDNFLKNRRRERGIANITLHDVARLYTKSWQKAATKANAQSSFRGSEYQHVSMDRVHSMELGSYAPEFWFNNNVNPPASSTPSAADVASIGAEVIVRDVSQVAGPSGLPTFADAFPDNLSPRIAPTVTKRAKKPARIYLTGFYTNSDEAVTGATKDVPMCLLPQTVQARLQEDDTMFGVRQLAT